VSQSRVSSALEEYLYPSDSEEATPRRLSMSVDAEVYRKVRRVADLLKISWARAANLLLLPASEDALAWIEENHFQAHYEGLDPELVEALADAEDPRYEEAMTALRESAATASSLQRVLKVQA
jgi:hypothetical protein